MSSFIYVGKSLETKSFSVHTFYVHVFV
jgi:hypothetical protein